MNLLEYKVMLEQRLLITAYVRILLVCLLPLLPYRDLNWGNIQDVEVLFFVQYFHCTYSQANLEFLIKCYIFPLLPSAMFPLMSDALFMYLTYSLHLSCVIRKYYPFILPNDFQMHYEYYYQYQLKRWSLTIRCQQ